MCARSHGGEATPTSRIRLPEGFKIERLYSVPKDEQGSWVAMCHDDKGRLIVSDQYGGLFRFPVPEPGEPLNPDAIVQITYDSKSKNKPLDGPDNLPDIGHAQGLCYAFDSLYVVVNGRKSATGSGVFRLLDTDGDDAFDKVVTIKLLDSSGGEHGPHAILPTPDGEHLYVVMGNQTQVPKDYTHSRVPEVWGEDQLFPSLQHFMVGTQAPLGHVARIDPEGKSWEIIATGFRNQYDAAFNHAGELFTYDADMEWDLNTPWYRPTRVNHVVDGAEFGWRTGSGKFMEYCSDTFGAVVNIGPGSPTGVTFGYGAKFPARYQNAFFISDWSYGKLYAVHLKPVGSTYTATFEEFASAQPLPITDILIHPTDQAMYFTVGGRKIQSGLFRVTYVGGESTAVASPTTGGEADRKQRHALEALLQKDAEEASDEQLEQVWKSLGSSDRGIRHAARVAVEKQPVTNWKDRVAVEKDPWIATAAMIALARVDGKASASAILERAMRFDYASIEKRQLRLDVLRSITLAITRGGAPSAELAEQLTSWLDGIYPAQTAEENRDLSALLAFLQAPSAAKKGVALLMEAGGQEEQIGYALNLRHLKTGWTPQLREQYFKWFVLSGSYRGGARLANYLADIKKHAIESVPKEEMTESLTTIIETPPDKKADPRFTLEPRPFVKEWAMEDFSSELANGTSGMRGKRSYKNGRKMFGVGTCYACHRFKGEGGAVGPDLTAAQGKFSPTDLLETIIDPSKEVSDQYAASVFQLADGKVLTGRIMNLAGGYMINTDMMQPSQFIKVAEEDVESVEPSPTSMMPVGLLNTMTRDDVLDLMAYVLSAGDPDHELFDGTSTGTTHELDPQQGKWIEKYKTQKNAPKPEDMLLNRDAEPDLSGGFTPLFNGTDLTGWTPKGGECTYEVRDGHIVGTCVPGSNSTYLCTDKDDYTDFVFTCDLKWDVDGNTGIQFRSKMKINKGKETVTGPQFEMEGLGKGDRHWSGGIYGQSCGGYFYPLWLKAHGPARAAERMKDWNRLTISAKGNVVKTWINGVGASHWIDDGSYASGFFALQVHKGPAGTIRFKNIRVKELVR